MCLEALTLQRAEIIENDYCDLRLVSGVDYNYYHNHLYSQYSLEYADPEKFLFDPTYYLTGKEVKLQCPRLINRNWREDLENRRNEGLNLTKFYYKIYSILSTIPTVLGLVFGVPFNLIIVYITNNNNNNNNNSRGGQMLLLTNQAIMDALYFVMRGTIKLIELFNLSLLIGHDGFIRQYLLHEGKSYDYVVKDVVNVCRMVNFLRSINMYASPYILMLISVERFYILNFTHQSNLFPRIRKSALCIVYGFSVAIGVMYAYNSEYFTWESPISMVVNSINFQCTYGIVKNIKDVEYFADQSTTYLPLYDSGSWRINGAFDIAVSIAIPISISLLLYFVTISQLALQFIKAHLEKKTLTKVYKQKTHITILFLISLCVYVMLTVPLMMAKISIISLVNLGYPYLQRYVDLQLLASWYSNIRISNRTRLNLLVADDIYLLIGVVNPLIFIFGLRGNRKKFWKLIFRK